MPTQLDNTWLPGPENKNDIILGGWMNITHVSNDVLEILTSIIFRGTRGKGKSIETAPKVDILKDSHSTLTSDDLLWYIR